MNKTPHLDNSKTIDLNLYLKDKKRVRRIIMFKLIELLQSENRNVPIKLRKFRKLYLTIGNH